MQNSTYEELMNPGIPVDIPEHCPLCNHDISLNCIFACRSRSGVIYVFLCPRFECQAVFFVRWNDEKFTVYPAEANMDKIFSDVSIVSPDFYETYRQSSIAELSGLDKICGMGYRRAAEFLVKDFLDAFGDIDKSKEEIYKMSFSSAISKLPNQELKALAKAASWLGNDEAHTFKKWTTYDIQNLKSFIQSLASYTIFKLNASEANRLINSKDEK